MDFSPSLHHPATVVHGEESSMTFTPNIKLTEVNTCIYSLQFMSPCGNSTGNCLGFVHYSRFYRIVVFFEKVKSNQQPLYWQGRVWWCPPNTLSSYQLHVDLQVCLSVLSLIAIKWTFGWTDQTWVSRANIKHMLFMWNHYILHPLHPLHTKVTNISHHTPADTRVFSLSRVRAPGVQQTLQQIRHYSRLDITAVATAV